jgi:Fanconi anemia group D2 protein
MGKNARRRSRGGLDGAPASKRRKRTEWTDSPFGRAVEPAGLVLSDGTEPNKLTVEPAIFQKKLSALFRRHPNTQEAVGEFAESLKKYTDNSVRFRQALLSTSVADGADVMSRSGGLDSLTRQLLSVDYLQPSVAHLLLLRLSSYMDIEPSSHSLNTRELCQMPALILNQLRWLDHIVNGKDLCRELLEVVGVAPVEIQREIVTAIPEILDDAQHNNAALELKSLLQSNSGLMAATIDALSSLNLTFDIEAEVLDVAMGCLGTASVADLPLILRFVVQQVNSKNAVEIIGEVREKLDIESSFLSHPAACSTPRSSSQRPSVRLSAEVSDRFMVFDAISSSIRFQKPVADGWMKCIEAVAEQSEHRVIDLFVLFILHSLPARKKAVETLFATKVRTQLFTEELLAAAFGPHAKALSEFFPSVLSLCESLLASSSPTITSFTTSLYHHLFSTFDIYCRQEVIGTLVTHIGSGMPTEVNHALDILATLVETRRSEMDRFAVLIKGVLDYLEHLSVGQIRRLYSVLSVLAFHDVETGGSGVQDEMHTLIRKQLSHVEPKYRRMGVVGAVMIIQQLGRRRETMDLSLRLTSGCSQSSSQSDSTLPPARRRQAISMLDDVMRNCSKSPDSAVLFCDEMTAAVQSLPLDHALLRHLCDETTSVFQDTFLVEVSDPLPSDLGLPVELAHGLDSSEEGSIAVNMFPLATRQDKRSQERGSCLRGMAAQFRLLRVCERILNGSLEGVDALLGAPVVMCVRDRMESERFEDLPLVKRQSVCLSLCHCHNWFRELVCAFSGEKDVDMRGKVMIRMKDITDTQTLLESCMAATPGFLPPLVTAEEVKAPVRPRRGKRLGSKGDTTVANTTNITQNVDKDSTTTEKTAGMPTVSLHLYRQYFRELDLGVFAILEYGPISRTLLDTEEHTREREELRLLPQQLSFLLHDLCHKLTTTLSHFGSRGLSGGKSRGRPSSGGGKDGGGKIQLFSVDELVSTTANLVDSLCEHLEGTSGFFQAQLEENDGIVDMQCTHDDYAIHCTNLDLLLRSMATFFAWPPLSDPHYSEQLYTGLKSLASRIGHTTGQQSSSIPELAPSVHKYLQQFSDSLPSLSSAHLLVKLMVAIGKTSPSLHPLISNSCQGLLQRKWGAMGTNQQRSGALEYLIRYHVEWSEDPLEALETIAGDGITDLLGEEASEESSSYPTLSSATLPCYYRALMSGLVGQMKAIPPPSKKTTPTTEECLERFHVLEVSAKVLYILVNVVKSFDRRTILSSALKVWCMRP